MKIVTEIEDTRMLDMLCNALYSDDTFQVDDKSYKAASDWCDANPEKVSDLELIQCYEPRIYAYLRGNKAHKLKVYDTYGEENLELTWDGMVKGMQLLASDQPSHFNDMVTENDDFYTANSWLQLALLGDVVYG